MPIFTELAPELREGMLRIEAKEEEELRQADLEGRGAEKAAEIWERSTRMARAESDGPPPQETTHFDSPGLAPSPADSDANSNQRKDSVKFRGGEASIECIREGRDKPDDPVQSSEDSPHPNWYKGWAEEREKMYHPDHMLPTAEEVVGPKFERPERPESDAGNGSRIEDFDRGRLCELLGLGLSQRQAAALVDVAQSTVSRLLKRDSDFAEKVERAQIRASVAPLLKIIEASKTNWRAAAWLLEKLEKRVRVERNEPIMEKVMQEMGLMPA